MTTDDQALVAEALERNEAYEAGEDDHDHDHAMVESPDPPLTMVEREPALLIGALGAALAAGAAALPDSIPKPARAALAGAIAGGAAALVRQRVTPFPDPLE